MTIADMATNYFCQVLCDVLHDSPSRPLTIPILSDSQSGIHWTSSDKEVKTTRHIERRLSAIRLWVANGVLSVHFINGDEYNVADLGTKNCSSPANSYKLSIVEADLQAESSS